MVAAVTLVTVFPRQIAVSNHRVKKRVLACIALAALVACNRSQHNSGQRTSAKQSAEPIQGRTPQEVVDELWRRATEGQLLTPQGWKRAGQLFTEPTIFIKPKVIFIVSNEWGPAFEYSAHSDEASVSVGFNPLGSIDSGLQYSQPSSALKQFVKYETVYELAAVPTYAMMYGPDGKTLISKQPSGFRSWKIKGSESPPFATVNTAIRYILAQRERTQDAVIRKNADETLRILMRLD